MNRIPHKQQGVVLFVSLILLLVLTLIAVSSMQSNIMEERMAGNMRNQDMAFQAAEAALRDGETFLQNPVLPAFDNTSGNFQPADPAAGETPRWESVDWSNAGSVHTYSGKEISGIASDPAYIVEEMPATASGSSLASDTPGVHEVYRITARAVGGSSDAVVILQSTYKR